MTITETRIGVSGVTYIMEYHDADSFDHLNYSFCRQVRAVCLCDGKLVIGYGGKISNAWGLIGGTIESGETFEQTLKREIREESNMEVISFLPVGYQKVTDTCDESFIYQLRYVCTARPYWSFISDPDVSIKKIAVIDTLTYKKYFDWHKIGDRVITRALELKSRLN